MAFEHRAGGSPWRGVSWVGAVLALLVGAAGARADLVISAGSTSNVTCGSGTCTATATNAVLNAGTLQTMLSTGNVTVTTANATDILAVQAPLTWSNFRTISLTARQSISIEAPIVADGLGGLALSTNGNAGLGKLAYTAPGRVNFKDSRSKLTINGLRYKLVTTIAQLAAAAAADQNARLALADNYAAPDQNYSGAPIPTFNGLFEGLGNTISNLHVLGSSRQPAGLFGSFGQGCARCGRIDGIALTGAVVTGATTGGLVGFLDAQISHSSVEGHVKGFDGPTAGGLAGSTSTNALIVQSHATATVKGVRGDGGGLVGDNKGTIRGSYALGRVATRPHTRTGGLVALNEGTITTSFASGTISGQGGFHSPIGGLVGENKAAIKDCYATGQVFAVERINGYPSYVGGLIGQADAPVATSYSTGAVSGGAKTKLGGFVGADASGGMASDYWDTDTSHITDPSAGAGNKSNDPGITGLTTAQLKAQLPTGFDPTVWARDPSVNGSLPYLIFNPPPQ